MLQYSTIQCNMIKTVVFIIPLQIMPKALNILFLQGSNIFLFKSSYNFCNAVTHT